MIKKIVTVFLVLCVIFILLKDRIDRFYVPLNAILIRTRKMKELEDRVTSSGDSDVLKIKKMVAYFLQPLLSYNPILEIIELDKNTKPDGCIDLDTMSSNLFSQIPVKLTEENVRKEITDHINKFHDEYKFYILTYKKHSDFTDPPAASGSSTAVAAEPRNKAQLRDFIQKFIESLVVPELKARARSLIPRRDTMDLNLVHPDRCQQILIEQLNSINYSESVKNIFQKMQRLSMKMNTLAPDCV